MSKRRTSLTKQVCDALLLLSPGTYSRAEIKLHVAQHVDILKIGTTTIYYCLKQLENEGKFLYNGTMGKYTPAFMRLADTKPEAVVPEVIEDYGDASKEPTLYNLVKNIHEDQLPVLLEYMKTSRAELKAAIDKLAEGITNLEGRVNALLEKHS